MKKLFMTLLILGAVVGLVAMLMKRRGSGMDEWRSLAEDTARDVADSAKEIADTATDAAKEATD